jgi:hypothetical protein
MPNERSRPQWVDTEIIDRVFEALKSNRVALVVGPPGVGRSATAMHVGDVAIRSKTFRNTVMVMPPPAEHFLEQINTGTLVILENADAWTQDHKHFIDAVFAKSRAVLIVGTTPPNWVPHHTADSIFDLGELIKHSALETAVVWDPEVLSAKDYADLVELLGDVARAQGGAGVERIRSSDLGVPVGSEVVP